MKDAKILYSQRLDRLIKAIIPGKPDRPYVIARIDTFTADYKGVKISLYSAKPCYTT